MKFFLKIINEVRGMPSLKVDGASGIRYIFRWDGKLRAYRYQPTKQEEVDDLFKTMGRTTYYVFAPVELTEAIEAVNVVESTKPTEAEKTPLDEKLIEGALLRGVVVTEDDTNEIIARLSQAYDRGATDALNNRGSDKRKARAAKETTPA
jgi:hypothetical protein